MNAREQRGLENAATAKITKNSDAWRGREVRGCPESARAGPT